MALSATLIGPLVMAGAARAASPMHTGNHDVRVVMTTDGFRLPAVLPAGWVTFHASTPDAIGHQLDGFRLRAGASVADVVTGLHRAASYDLAESAAGTRAVARAADLVGGPAVDPVTGVAVSVWLPPGRYWFFDFDDPYTPGQEIRLHPVLVRGRSGGARAPRADHD